MERCEDVLRMLSDEYLREGRKIGFSNKQLLAAVVNAINSEVKTFTKDMTEDEYCDLFKRAMYVKSKSKAYFPKDEHVKKTAKIMYIIHNQGYTSTEQFVEIVSLRLNSSYSNVKSGLVGINPYSGLRYFLKVYLLDFFEGWEKQSIEKRVKILEDIEKQHFKLMLEIEAE